MVSLALVTALFAGAASCSRNPATGRLQFGLVSENDEVALGRKADEDIRKTLGVYDSKALSEMVTRVGTGLAAQSERPDLPWTFVVLDEPMVNAFALPGGWVYVTRGLLAHLGSEDELAAVLGHEAGHVTARHGVVQLRKQRAAQRSVGVFRIVDPNLRHVGGIAAATAGLALLKHSREDEHEADDLGLRYLVKGGYNANAITEMFGVLAQVSAADDAEDVPPWLSTHPEPKLRQGRMASRITEAGIAGSPVAADPKFLAALDGMVFGADPRSGFFVGSTYVHPRRGFQIDVPAGWEGQHSDDRILAASEDERSMFALGPSDAETAEAALDGFFEDGRLKPGEVWRGDVAGFHVESSAFTAGTEAQPLAGLVAFVDYDDGVVSMLALGDVEVWEDRLDSVATAFASFAKIRSKQMREVKPMRLDLFTVPKPMTIVQVHEESRSVVDVETLALINHATADETLAAGRVIKVVHGFNPERLAEVVGATEAKAAKSPASPPPPP